MLACVRAEPFPSHQRTCITGQTCTIAGLSGTGMGDGDTIALLGTCGLGPAPEGMPGAFGRTLPAVDYGRTMSWSEPITPDGGEYQMCWCGAAGACANVRGFDYSVGTMVITGPKSGLTESCVGGRLCSIDGMEGTFLRNNDSVMVLHECGTNTAVEGFPNGGKTTTGAMAGTEHGWAESKIAALGGTFNVCWCAKGMMCAEGIHHRKWVGTLTVIGPFGSFVKTCRIFEPCAWAEVTGLGLKDDDRMMVLEKCGEGAEVPGFPNSGIASASGGGRSFSFGNDDVVLAGGAEYELCWCGAGVGHVCTKPVNFVVNAGTLTVLGPRTDHDVSCIRGQVCELADFRGLGLAGGDKVKIMLECGIGSSPAGFPNDGVLTSSNFGQRFASWTTPLIAQHGTYRICWCRADWSCPPVSGFKADAGALRVVGVDSGQQKSCHVLDGCSITGVTGSNLRNGDLIKVLTSCSGTGTEVPGWPNNGTSNPATNSGASFSWGLVERVHTLPGTYKMCWCPYEHFSGCDDIADFSVEVGDMLLKGPAAMSKNGTCSAFQVPACIVGPFSAGVGFNYGKDKVLLVKQEDSCRDSARDSEVGGSTFGKTVKLDGLIYWDPGDLPYGGVWKMCYCADYDSGLDSDSEPCSSAEDFPAEVGFLTVGGAYPGQSVNCTRNQFCTFNLKGQALNKDIHQVAIRDDSASCGSRAPLDGATRRRRFVTGNPYPAVARVSASELTFMITPVQALATFYICFCVPPPAASHCGSGSLLDFDQLVGALDIRGAAPNQTFICGRGGYCTLEVHGRHLSNTDFVKVVSIASDCSGEAQNAGFFRSLLPADPGAKPDVATFRLGRVTAEGSFKICYCASLNGCDAMDEYNHLAGILVVLDPLSDLALQSATATSIVVTLNSRIESPMSEIRCAVAEYEPFIMPDAASITAGLDRVGLGTGVATQGTRNGTNTVEIFFDTFVGAGRQYRVWCVETSAQSFVMPGHSGGAIVITPETIELPRLRVYPSFLWARATFYAELFQLVDETVDSSSVVPRTLVRVTTGASLQYCNKAEYDEAFSMQVTDPGQPGEAGATLMSNGTLSASEFRTYVCLFTSPRATGVAMSNDKLVVQANTPSFSQRRLDGQVTTKFYRGVLMQVMFVHTSPYTGLLHWARTAAGGSAPCAGARRVPPAAQLVTGANTSFFRFEDPVGLYTMCYLGRQSESTTAAPFNSIGEVEVTDTITDIKQDPVLPSTRNTVRIEIEVRVPGLVICVARGGPGDMGPSDFNEGVAYQGRAYVNVEPVPAGTDPEYPRLFRLAIPLLYYQRTVGPMHVWCHHAAAEDLVFPETREGARIFLQAQEPGALSAPAFVWTGARFKLALLNTPTIGSKLVAVHEPPLPNGWSREVFVDDDGKERLRYTDASGSTADAHPVYTAWAQSFGPNPCEGSNISAALAVTEEDYTETSDWFKAHPASPFVCFWASRDSYPHLIQVLDITAQSPQFALEVGGQLRPFVYRGVDVTFRLKHTSPTGGRVLVVRKTEFDSYGDACQNMGLVKSSNQRSLRGSSSAPRFHPPNASGHGFEEARWSSAIFERRAQAQCQNLQRRTSELALEPAAKFFPMAQWGEPLGQGLNCSRDFKLFYSPVLQNTSVLADKVHGRYFMITSNISVLLQFFPRVRLLNQGVLPNTSQVIVLQSNVTTFESEGQAWVVSTNDCTTQVLLSAASPMHEEGAEYLPLGEYEKAALELTGFNFHAFAYIHQGLVQEKEHVCQVLQPPASPPKRPESPLDIDQPGLGRTVKDDVVWVPSMVNGSGSFLHNDDLGEYVVCYVGDATAANPFFNPIGASFESRDVLPVELFMGAPASNSLRSYLNVTSNLRGIVRCIALLRNMEPPTEPDDIFRPNMANGDYLGSSELVQFDVPETSIEMAIDLDQVRAKFIAPSESYAQAKPTMYVWCAHKGSTVIYPSHVDGFKLKIESRHPPPFQYVQLNGSITVIELTLALEFTPINVVFQDPAFPVNQYDEVQFSSSPMLPSGLVIDTRTGAISGKPDMPGNYTRTIVATSRSPPHGHSSVGLVIDIQDVLGLKTRSVNVDHIVFSIRPRSTDLFASEEVFVLIQNKKMLFTNQPAEFFCLANLLRGGGNGITFKCKVEGGACCCGGYIETNRRVQDVRISVSECGLALASKYHVAGMVKGKLTTPDGVRTSGLRSSRRLDINVPEEKDASLKSPVTFDLVFEMSVSEWLEDETANKERLVEELHAAVAIPRELVEIGEVSEAAAGGRRLSGGFARLEIGFSVEPRCLEQRSQEVEVLSIGINVQAGCSRVAPEEYMDELRAQLTDKNSALYERDDLGLLQIVSYTQSFSYMRLMHFCNQEPFWRYGAVVARVQDCPFDLIKLGALASVGITIVFFALVTIVCHASADISSVSFLYKIRVLDICTPMLALYTCAADYMWLLMLQQPDGGSGSGADRSTRHPLFDTFFMFGLCHLVLCFCVNALALRITITSYILDTPWWRRNRKRLRVILFLSTVSPRFFRITRANLFGFDTTHIHFGTPSKMAVVFSNLGLVTLLEDVPQLLLHSYVWLVWRNQGPRIGIVCFVLSTQSIAVAALHHIFSRSQRAAYERVVKLLGVRRLTAGFFDVSANVGNAGGSLMDSMRRKDAGTNERGDDFNENGDNKVELDDVVDPTRLDPIAAAMYVSQMYEKEARARALQDEQNDEDAEEGSEGDSDAEGGTLNDVKSKTKDVYPKHLYAKMKKFYELHDPARVKDIRVGDVKVDEAKLDADLKKKFGQGLESVD